MILVVERDSKEQAMGNKHWTQTTAEEKRQDLIERLITAGLAFSKWMRCRETIQIQFREPCFGGSWRDLLLLATFHLGEPIIEYVNSADLHYIQAAKKEQAYWTAKEWKKEILDRLEIIDRLRAQ